MLSPFLHYAFRRNGALIRRRESLFPCHEEKIRDARKLPEAMRFCQLLCRRLRFAEGSQQESFTQEHLYVILQRAVPAQHWRGKFPGDLVFPNFPIEIMIDFEEQQIVPVVWVTFPCRGARRK